MARLLGKAVVVTGGSIGIGAGIVEKLASEGAAVTFTYARSAEPARKLEEKIRQSGGKALAVQADVRDRGQVAALFEKATAEFGSVDVLVNNAGIYEFSPVEGITDDHIDRQFNTNVKGLLYATQEAVKAFGDRGGAVINISSVVAEMPPPNASVYSATKAAVDAITRSLAVELGPRKIRVVSVNPGATTSEGFSSMPGSEQMSQYLVSQTPLGRMGEPADIANVVAFVASPEAAWITGAIIPVSGGIRV